MNDLTGTLRLARVAGRRDRIRLLLWIAGIVALVVVTVGSTKGLYTTQAQLDDCLLYTSPSPRDGLLSRMPSSA